MKLATNETRQKCWQKMKDDKVFLELCKRFNAKLVSFKEVRCTQNNG